MAMESMGMMRDLDQIQERDDQREGGRVALIGFGGLAAACVLFAVGVAIGKDHEAARSARTDDPLARLDALAGIVADAGAPVVTYPDRLIDPAARTAAGLAVTAAPTAPGAQPGATPFPTSLLANNARPLVAPAAAMLDVNGQVRDALPGVAQLPVATANAQLRAGLLARSPSQGPAEPGADGPYTLQVSSFRTGSGAQVFAQRLRERGYRSFVAAGTATVNGAVWHRVRIGPFTSLGEANHYRQQFELRERLPSFVVRREAVPHT